MVSRLGFPAKAKSHGDNVIRSASCSQAIEEDKARSTTIRIQVPEPSFWSDDQTLSNADMLRHAVTFEYVIRNHFQNNLQVRLVALMVILDEEVKMCKQAPRVFQSTERPRALTVRVAERIALNLDTRKVSRSVSNGILSVRRISVPVRESNPAPRERTWPCHSAAI